MKKKNISKHLTNTKFQCNVLNDGKTYTTREKTLMDGMPPLVFFLSTRYLLACFSSFLLLPASFLLHTNTLYTFLLSWGYGKAHACGSVQQLRWRILCLKGCLSILSLRWACRCILLLWILYWLLISPKGVAMLEHLFSVLNSCVALSLEQIILTKPLTFMFLDITDCTFKATTTL